METRNVSKPALWISYILQGLVTLLLLFGAGNNLLRTEMAVQGAVEMGYPDAAVLYLGVILLLCAVLYAVPPTKILGAVLLTGWLGGAVATHVIHHDPMPAPVFPVIFGVIVWGALWMREESLRAIFPFRK
jgi:hypothetical protein